MRLHLTTFLHRDVKLGNILMNSRGAVKLTDFGISKQINDERFGCDTFVGTATYMAPERVRGEDYSFAADIWSLGLCAYELASGKYPYGNVSSYPALFEMLVSNPVPSLPNDFSPELVDFTNRALHKNALNRATAIQLLAHPFIIENLFRVSQDEFVAWLAHHMRRHPP